MKLCKTCRSKKRMNRITTTKTKSKKLWKKGFHTHSEFPKNKKPDLNKIKIIKPVDADIQVNIDMGPDYAHRYVYYYASLPSKKCVTIKQWDAAYRDFENSGISKMDKDGKATLHIQRPQVYIEDMVTYFPHIHFLLTNRDNSKWINKLYTKGVVIKITKKEVKKHIKSGCSMILNALPFQYYVKNRIPNSMPLPHKLVGSKLTEKDVDNYLRKMVVHYPKIHQALMKKKITLKQIPIITYCYDSGCNASYKLMNKLWLMGYSNIVEYPGGIMGWMQKK